MQLFKRPDSEFWYVDLVNPVTKRRAKISTKETNKKKALVVSDLIMARLRDDAIRRAGGRVSCTLQAAVVSYTEHLKSEDKVSWVKVEEMMKKTFGLSTAYEGRFAIDGSLPLEEVTPMLMDRLVKARRKEGNGAQTIAHEIKMLRAAARHAAGLGHHFPDMTPGPAGKNPWRMPKLTQKTRWLSHAEWDAIYAYLDPEQTTTKVWFSGTLKDIRNEEQAPPTALMRAQRQDVQDLFIALTMTGGRWSEVANMAWPRVDTKGFAEVRLWGGKTQNERIVPCPEIVSTMLRRRHAERDCAVSLVFPGQGGQPRHDSSCKPILRAMEACGLNSEEMVKAHGRATVHSLRHTFASWLVQNGADLAEISDALGHTTLQMTRRYAHLSKGAAAKRLGGIMDRLMGKGGDAETPPDGQASERGSI